jgi:hypothetical protein
VVEDALREVTDAVSPTRHGRSGGVGRALRGRRPRRLLRRWDDSCDDLR